MLIFVVPSPPQSHASDPNLPSFVQDHDGSGYITVDELRKGLSRCSVDPRATDVERLVTHMDARNGGRGGALRYEEFRGCGAGCAADAHRADAVQHLL